MYYKHHRTHERRRDSLVGSQQWSKLGCDRGMLRVRVCRPRAPGEKEATVSVNRDPFSSSGVLADQAVVRVGSFYRGRGMVSQRWEDGSACRWQKACTHDCMAWDGRRHRSDEAMLNTRCAACSFSPINHKLIRSTRMEE